ncbi:hypothetical protein LTR10_002139 [Elasticomyces elasticus]|nr:hypothetical protein LTR10_002139 [Elasticomyces elasticus]KAK4973786.1 hypothetical protein LTR42_005776 [Elasticomyces elasticus]
MAPGPIETEHIHDGVSQVSLKDSVRNGTKSRYETDGPLITNGALDHLESSDLTPVIGREFPTTNLVKLINSPNADELLRELAYTISSESEVGEVREADQEISTITSKLFQKIYSQQGEDTVCEKKQSSNQWHAGISFEPVPADYTSLRLIRLPTTGGDTLWASGYEIYDRLSPHYQKFLEGLTATFAQPGFIAAA